MEIQELVRKLLVSDSTLTGLVKHRIRPLAFTSLDVRPAVAYQIRSTETFEHSTGTAEWRTADFQIDTFADTYSAAVNVAKAIKAVLHNYAGTVEDCEVGISKHKGDDDLTEPPEVGQENVINRLSSQYRILYRSTGGLS